MHLAGQELSAVTAGFQSEYLRINHNPHPCLRFTIEQFFIEKTELFEKNMSYKLRSSKQVLIQFLASYLEIKKNNAIIDNSLSTLVFNKRDRNLSGLEKKLKLAEEDGSIAFVCVQGSTNSEIRNIIYSWLDTRVGSIVNILENDIPLQQNS